MSDLDTSTQGLWWLKPQDHGPDNTSANMMNAARLQQQNRQLNMQQQEQDAMLPLKRQQAQQQIEMQAAQLHEQQNNMEYQKQVRIASGNFSKIYTMAGSLPDGWADPSIRMGMGELAIQFPAIVDSPIWKEADKNIQTAMEQSNKLKVAREETKRHQETLNAPTAAQKDIQMQIYKGLSSGLIKPEDADKKFYEILNAHNDPKGQNITMWDANGNPILNVNSGGGDVPTIKTQNASQQNIIAQQKSFDLLNELQNEIRPGDVGVRGVTGELIDRFVGQFAPDQVDLKRADNRTKMKTSLENMTRQITADQRISESDKKRALNAAFSAGADESYPRMIESIKTLKDIISKRAIIDAQGAGMTIPDYAMSPEQIKAAAKSGIMTPAKARDLLLKYHRDALSQVPP